MNVYLIHQTNSNLYKVGVSKHVRKRLKENQTGNGNTLKIISSVPSEIAYKVETLIHKRWQNKRQVGEWFELTEGDVNGFENLCREIEMVINYLQDNNTWVQSVKNFF